VPQRWRREGGKGKVGAGVRKKIGPNEQPVWGRRRGQRVPANYKKAGKIRRKWNSQEQGSLGEKKRGPAD